LPGKRHMTQMRRRSRSVLPFWKYALLDNGYRLR
jgi:hypothetical protein